MATKFINLDAVASAPILTFILNGKEFPMKAMTVGMMAENARATSALKMAASQDEELAATMNIILRSFPGMVVSDIEGLTMDQLNYITDAIQNGDADEVADAVPDELGNDKPAS